MLNASLFFQWIELNTKNSTKRQQSCHLVEFLVFNSAFGRYRHWLIWIASPYPAACWIMVKSLVVLINQCLCLPKAELNNKNSTKRQQSCRFVEFLVFNSAFGRHSHELIPIAWSSSSFVISRSMRVQACYNALKPCRSLLRACF